MVTYLIIAALVIWSALYVFKKVFPQTAFKCFSSLADFAQAQGQNKLAQWLRPAMPMGCGGGCGCSTDAPAKKVKVETQAVKWK
ncbi:DUF6587 family protein [Acinetobacter sp. MD2(2019)]|uniref:DUF6587 family protein n=1 Tax=Acinetobacter sp. MD2(2019) TaxID=2605273 RepID=UPI002D1EFB36|nr:DUF6587 family protein [Acinetobacter sp. MD2(2019)]MEB3755034.1 hypothetical protein [Acinetobacter sp. MD2(2019)]